MGFRSARLQNPACAGRGARSSMANAMKSMLIPWFDACDGLAKSSSTSHGAKNYRRNNESRLPRHLLLQCSNVHPWTYAAKNRKAASRDSLNSMLTACSGGEQSSIRQWHYRYLYAPVQLSTGRAVVRSHRIGFARAHRDQSFAHDFA